MITSVTHEFIELYYVDTKFKLDVRDQMVVINYFINRFEKEFLATLNDRENESTTKLQLIKNFRVDL